MARGSRLVLSIVLALALHGLAAIVLMRTRDTAVTEDVVMEVILAAPPRQKAASPAPRPRPSQAPALASRTGPSAATPTRRSPTLDWRVRAPQGGEQEGVRRTLRSNLGCDRAKLLSLTAEEQAACEEKLAEGAREARAYAVISPKLKKEFDGVFECPKDDVWCEYRIGKAPYPGLLQLGRKKKRSDWD